MGLKESEALFASQYGRSFYWASIGSYAEEFLPMIFPNSHNFKRLLCLGCGHGGDLVAARLFFGDSIKLLGLDNEPALKIMPDSKELERNLEASSAKFIFMDMREIEAISLEYPDIDVIIIRHPARLTDEEEYKKATDRLVPWFKFAFTHSVPLILSVFEWQKDARDKLAKEAISIAGNSKVRLVNLPEQRKYKYYSTQNTFLYKPDQYGFVMME